MSLLDAVVETGPAPGADTPQAGKKRYSELLSRNLVRSWVRLVDADTGAELSEGDYFLMLRDLFNARNPHASLGDPAVAGDDE